MDNGIPQGRVAYESTDGVPLEAEYWPRSPDMPWTGELRIYPKGQKRTLKRFSMPENEAATFFANLLREPA